MMMGQHGDGAKEISSAVLCTDDVYFLCSGGGRTAVERVAIG